MATATKLIDINRSYVPVDPATFPENLFYNSQEDAPEGRVPVVPYDGYNFMPTGNGYMSYFGINSELGVDALLELVSPFTPLNVDDIFIVQTPDLRNIGVALTEDGIWTKHLATPGAWSKIITLTVPDSGTHRNWSRCVIGNEVYLYRANEAHHWVMRDAEDFVPTEQTPDTLNMTAQQGIFKAGGRLGYWDSDSSVAWSDIDVKTDYVPSLETGAGAQKFQNVKGKIANILSHGNGFIIYATKSITHVQRGSDANFFWIAQTVFDDNGISYKDNVTQGQPDTTHFAYTTFGIVKIENGRPEYIIPEVFSWLKEKREVIYPKILEGRYLFLQFIDPSFNLGIVEFSHETVPGSTITFKGASYNVEHISQNPCKALKSAEQQHEGVYLFNTFGYVTKGEATEDAEVPIWEDILGSALDIDVIKAFKTALEAGTGIEYFSGVAFAQGGIPRIDAGTEFFIPALARSIPLVSGYAQTTHTEDNTRDFYSKQDFLWLYEAWFQDTWLKAIKNKPHVAIGGDVPITFQLSSSVQTKHSFGPYLDLSFLSEANKYYGLAEKSAWLQRSLTKGINIGIVETQEVWGDTEYHFNLTGSNPQIGSADPDVETEAQATASAAAAWAESEATYLSTLNWLVTYAFQSVTTVGNRITVKATRTFVETPVGTPNGGIDNPEMYFDKDTNIERQYFSVPQVTYVDYDTCLYAELGYTKIKGKGHYDENGDLVEDFEAIYTNDEAGALQFLLDNGSHANEAALWASVGAANKTEFLEFYEGLLPPNQFDGYIDLLVLLFGEDWYLLGATPFPEDPDYTDICDANPEKKKTVLFNGTPIPPSLPGGCTAGDVTIDTETFTYPDQTITLPESSFLLQDGSIEPIYPNFAGAFVYDLHYKKWGKCGQSYKQIFNWSPINSVAGDKPVPVDIFNVNAGCLLADGTIKLFDKYPVDSILKIGKIGYYRKGFTDCELIDIQHRSAATGSIIIEGSLDGKNIEPAISQIYNYENVNNVRAPFSTSAKWFDMTITGIYDIRNIDFNGHRKGKR